MHRRCSSGKKRKNRGLSKEQLCSNVHVQLTFESVLLRRLHITASSTRLFKCRNTLKTAFSSYAPCSAVELTEESSRRQQIHRASTPGEWTMLSPSGLRFGSRDTRLGVTCLAI
jgi:hypothetical protein